MIIIEMIKKRSIAIIISLGLICVDQLSKYFFYDLSIWSQIPFFNPLMNDWISRGMSAPMVLILIVSIICLVIFWYLFHKKYFQMLEFVLLFAWTIGNMIDRIWLWWVRDFISIGSFPVFNIADAFLTCGVAWICIKEIFHLQTNEKKIISK